jgi:hAT family C-terminal dimerisation region
MDLMPVQATSVPSERIFSASKQTTTARRNRLGPKIMEAMQILKFEAKNQRKEVNFTKGLSLQEEFDDLEEREGVTCTEILKEYLNSMHEEK